MWHQSVSSRSSETVILAFLGPSNAPPCWLLPTPAGARGAAAAEEARWRAELREREAQRMMVLESEWRRRERAREAEIVSLKAEYLALEDRAQQV
jgi:hypothetical protein